jgi:hypothetical protein
MKLIGRSARRIVLQLGKREKDALLRLIECYPCVPSGYQSLSKSARLPDAKGNQKLLDDALVEQRVENSEQLSALMHNSKSMAQTQTGWRFSLSFADLEWLLQVINDIRVGSWLMLGSPGDHLEVITEKTAPYIWAMEMAGRLQMAFLEILQECEKEC